MNRILVVRANSVEDNIGIIKHPAIRRTRKYSFIRCERKLMHLFNFLLNVNGLTAVCNICFNCFTFQTILMLLWEVVHNIPIPRHPPPPPPATSRYDPGIVLQLRVPKTLSCCITNFVLHCFVVLCAN